MLIHVSVAYYKELSSKSWRPVLDYDCQNASKLGVPMPIRLMEEIRAGEIIIVVEVKCSQFGE